MFGMALVANELILITVTEKWAPCVPILQLLCVWGAFSPICELYKNIVISHGKSNIYLYANVRFGILQILLLIMMLPYGILWMVAAYVLAYLCWLLVWHCFASHLIGVRLYHVIRDILPYFSYHSLSFECAGGSLSSREYLYTVCFEDYCVCDFIHWNYVGCEVCNF